MGKFITHQEVAMTPSESRLTFVSKSETNPRKALYKCSCGNTKEMYTCNVSTGKSKSCGCLQSEVTTKRSFKHGGAARGSHARMYNTWGQMKARCSGTYRHDYPRYGGRGISVCERWLDFSKFYEDMGEAPDGMTLDRIDSSGNYEPGNCKWSTPKEQANNRRSNVYIEHDGRRQNIEAWSVELGINRGTIESRIKREGINCGSLLRPVPTR